MPTDKLPIGELLSQAWRDALAALRAMPGPALSLWGILIGGDALARILAGWGAGRPLIWLFNIAISFLTIHYLIMVHRFVLLGEIAPRFRLEPRDRLTWRFFGMWLALMLIPVVPSVLLGALVLMGVGRSAAAPTVTILTCLVLFGWTLRMSVLLPGIAIGAPGATWANAYEDTRGHAWRIVGTFAAAGVAIAAIWLAAATTLPSGLATQPGGAAGISVILRTMVFDAIVVFSSAYFVALASRIFERVADRMARPPDVPVARD